MYILARLVFKSYMPKQIEKGMWFKKDHRDVVFGKIYDYFTIYELLETPRNMDSFLQANGAPVEPYIVQPMRNRDEPEQILVRPDNIGWWEMDEGTWDENDEWEPNITLEDLSPKIINAWIHGENADNDGLIAIEVDENGDPLLYEDSNKVVIKPTDHVGDNEWYEDSDDYQDWDDMDDEPEEDSAGHTINDRYNPDDYETE